MHVVERDTVAFMARELQPFPVLAWRSELFTEWVIRMFRDLCAAVSGNQSGCAEVVEVEMKGLLWTRNFSREELPIAVNVILLPDPAPRWRRREASQNLAAWIPDG